MRTITLVGGCGFIGEYLSCILQKNKNCKVKILKRRNNLKRDFDKKTEVLVILTQPDKKIISDITYLASHTNKLKKILYLSTTLLYPESGLKQPEDQSPKPLTEYEKLKYQEEEKLKKIAKNAKCKLCIARLSNVYGDVKNRGIISKLLKSIPNKKDQLIINGDPEQIIKDYIFVEDAVNFLEFLVFYSQNLEVEIFNICTGKGCSLKQVINEIERIASKRINYKIGKLLLEKRINIGENKKIIKLSGLKIVFNLKRGLEKTYLNYKSHLV